MGIALGVEVPSEFLIGRSGDDALFIKEGKDSGVFPVDEVENFLVVWEGDKFPQNAFTLVLVLFELKHVLVELLLKCL